ncbi:MAG: MFS transporter [Caldilineales bacterium]|nr:MFS transporter [Caldilineales bacterium]
MTVSAAASPASPSPFAVFRSRNFTLMWTAQLVSTIGTGLTSIAAGILVFRVTDSVASLSILGLLSMAFGLFVGLYAGVFVDTHDRRRTMIAADLTRCLLVATIPIGVTYNIAWLYIIVMVATALNAFFDPAHESLLPEVASNRDLAAANSLMAISAFGSTAIGFAASGLIAGSIGIAWAFYIDALTFLFSAICISLVRVQSPSTEADGEAGNIVQNIRIGYEKLLETPALRSLFLASTPMLIGFGLANYLLLPFSDRALGATEFQYGLQEGLTSVGFVAGSLLMAGIFNRMREGPWIAISLIGMSVVGIIYSFNSSIPFAIVLLMFSGFLNAPSSIGRRLIVQRNTPREMRGRVNSAFFISRDLLFMIGIAAAALADVIDVRVMYFISSLLVLISGVWVIFAPGLRQEAAEWRQALSLLRGGKVAPDMGAGRPVLALDLDILLGCVPVLATLSQSERQQLQENGTVFEVSSGTMVLRQGDEGDETFFVLDGRLVAGYTNLTGEERYLSTMSDGDFFGEISSLQGVQRTANVVAEHDSALFRVPATMMQQLMEQPAFSHMVSAKMNERLARSDLGDLPKMAGYDQKALRELRTTLPDPVPA